jgi:hypothetical protein
VGQFWAFVNLVQMLMYVPLINVALPPNFQSLLVDYLSLCQIVIPFNLLPDWVPNLQRCFDWFFTSPLSETFRTAGLASLSFLYNFSGQLTTWVITGAIYILLAILDQLRPEHRSFQFVMIIGSSS